MSNRRKFIKQSLIGTAGVAIGTLAAGKSYALITGAAKRTPAIGAFATWGYTIGQREVPKIMIHENFSDFKVYPNHPRLFFRDTDLPVIRQRIKKDFRSEWEEMVRDLDPRVLSRPARTFAEGAYLKGWTNGRNVTFVAAITGEEKYITWAKQWAEALVAAGPVGNDDEYRGRLVSLAVAYDWLYAWLSAVEKERLQNAILEHIEKNWYFAKGAANYVGGHSRRGNFVLAAGLLAIITERPELRDKLLVIRDHWIKGYHPAQGWIARDGGYHMGWAYSAAYLTGDSHSVWSSATNECVYYPWQALTPLFWIYGRQGDGFYPNTGDAYTISQDLNSERNLLMIAAGVFKNPHAAWMIKPSADRFADILYGDKSIVPVAPDSPKASLPLSRHFRNAGVVIARDRWDEKTTQLQFQAVPFYTSDHLHRDENSFTLHYKGPLAIDSGAYYLWGSSYWRNYLTRTVAHNCIIVFDPEQKMTALGKPASNDGGQTYRNNPSSLQDILPGGRASLDGITQYHNTDEYTYSAGDATKAYDAGHVRLAQREIIYLSATSRPHPVVIIFDRVESTKPEFEKRFLLHTVNKPAINGKIAVADNKGGRLSCLTMFPEDAVLQLVGGAGKEGWVDGENYPLEREPRPPVDPGSWRLEVSPGTRQTTDYFLHVLFVDDDDASPVTGSETQLVKEDKNMGVIVGGWKVTFPLAAGSSAQVERAL